jgi:hypothetical protein
MPMRPNADACVGLVVCASTSRRTLPQMLAWRPHGSQRGCGGASPTQSCLQGQTSVRTGMAGRSGRRLALRRRGRDAPREHRGQADLRGKAVRQRRPRIPHRCRIRTRQSTGQSGHGTNGYLHRWAGLHRRTPHGRAFACSARTQRHLVSNRTRSRRGNAATKISLANRGRWSTSASRNDGKSLRFRRATASLPPPKFFSSTSRAESSKTRFHCSKRPQEPKASGASATRSWKR